MSSLLASPSTRETIVEPVPIAFAPDVFSFRNSMRFVSGAAPRSDAGQGPASRVSIVSSERPAVRGRRAAPGEPYPPPRGSTLDSAPALGLSSTPKNPDDPEPPSHLSYRLARLPRKLRIFARQLCPALRRRAGGRREDSPIWWSNIGGHRIPNPPRVRNTVEALVRRFIFIESTLSVEDR